MSSMRGEDRENIWEELVESSRTDYRTATYLLLLDRKQRGLPLRLASATRTYFRGKLVRLNKIFRRLLITMNILNRLLPFQNPEGTPKPDGVVSNFITKLDQSPRSRVMGKSPVAEQTYTVLQKPLEAGRVTAF